MSEHAHAHRQSDAHPHPHPHEDTENPWAGQGAVLLDIGVPIWARISRHSLKDLGLNVGQRAWCLVKAVSFDTDGGK